jgi:hypothetical protein
MANITIQNLEVESTALNQLSPGEMEKVVGGWFFQLPEFTVTGTIGTFQVNLTVKPEDLVRLVWFR